MKTLKAIIFIMVLSSTDLHARMMIDENLVKSINQEMVEAIENRDITVLKKYLFDKSIVYLNMSPDISEAKTKIGSADYLKMTEMSFDLLDDTDVQTEILSIDVNKEDNTATIESMTTSSTEMFGSKTEDKYLSKVEYGVIKGQVKILSIDNSLVSSSIVN